MVQEGLAGSNLLEFDELIGGVCLVDVAGTTHNGLGTSCSEQSRLGAVGDLACRGDSAEQLRKLDGGTRRVGIEAGNHGQRRELNPCLRALLSHALLQLIAVGLYASTEPGGVHRADAAELELGPAPICDDTAGGAAIDEVHAGRRVGNVVGLVVRSLLPELVSQRADKPDGACGVLDRIDTLRGQGGVSGTP